MHDTTARPIHGGRRGLLGAAAGAIAGLGLARPAGAQPAAPPPAAPAGPAAFGVPKQIRAGGLDIGYVEAGPPDGAPVVLLHGWPYDIHSYADVVPLLAARGHRVIVPHLRGYGTTRFLSADAPRNGQPSALALDAVALMDALGIRSAILGGYDWGARTAAIVAALWPERARGLVSASGYLIGSQAANRMPLAPEAELRWWYQYYFATERGAEGYARNTKAFARLIWQTASPRWTFDDATFERSAASLENPDHVAITIHNYRWRLGLAEGEAQYDEIERRLAAGPAIPVPTITVEGDANGAPHAEPASYRGRFTGPYAHRVFGGGVGHNPPQEAPHAFAAAILDLAAA
jgi:pimeloyl-ACP methyl ester carboxylesterase